ncbi:hypothetical protein [Bradyrhizobium sp. th.b2]|uniref:hypothetical protein n=1 Tax=Bradyrhizobium sp. th-b2 TaxID=172088 RepID=UPI0012EBF1B3|nr:hypothetical protein [Bradyrhizobium sp. th.b2]
MPFETSLSTEAFCAAFVSALVTAGINSVRPRSDAARAGFQAVMDRLDDEISLARQRNDREGMYSLLKIRTDLAPSSNGEFDNFESCLRSLQTSMVSSPNPAFADLRFNVSRSYAESSLEFLESGWAELAKSAARRFDSPSESPADERRLPVAG